MKDAVPPVRLKPATTRSPVKHSTTEPLYSILLFCGICSRYSPFAAVLVYRFPVRNYLAHLSLMEFPTLFIGPVHFHFKGCFMVYYNFILILNRTFREQTVEILIRCSATAGLVLRCLLTFHLKDARVI